MKIKEFKGSQRCMIKLISSPDFLTHLNSIIKDTDTTITNNDVWIPKGLNDPRESQLKSFLKSNFGLEIYNGIVEWWMLVNVTTPTWDFVSTCNINGKKGILLIEAKAHQTELESSGKKLKKDASKISQKNHFKIGTAINEAKIGINETYNGVSISSEKCYQLSNRVAHAWWLANNGIPVVLLYLGFLDAEDMNYGRRVIFKSEKNWKDYFINHAQQVGVDGIVDQEIDCGRSSFKLIVRSI